MCFTWDRSWFASHWGSTSHGPLAAARGNVHSSSRQIRGKGADVRGCSASAGKIWSIVISLSYQATMLRRSSLRRLMTKTSITTGGGFMTDRISPTQFRESEGVDDWRVLGDGANAYFRTGSYAAGARLVQAISELPGIDDLLPDVDVRHDGVTVRMVAFIEGYGGMLRGHVELARKISAAAR